MCVLSIQAQGVAEAEGRRGCPIRPKDPSGGTAGGSAAGRGSNHGPTDGSIIVINEARRGIGGLCTYHRKVSPEIYCVTLSQQIEPQVLVFAHGAKISHGVQNASACSLPVMLQSLKELVVGGRCGSDFRVNPSDSVGTGRRHLYMPHAPFFCSDSSGCKHIKKAYLRAL